MGLGSVWVWDGGWGGGRDVVFVFAHPYARIFVFLSLRLLGWFVLCCSLVV